MARKGAANGGGSSSKRGGAAKDKASNGAGGKNGDVKGEGKKGSGKGGSMSKQGDQNSNGIAGQNKIICADIQYVQNLIERCLQQYMTRKDVVFALQYQARIEPGFTTLVWQKLEEQNPDFFMAYHVRVRLKEQVVLFNHLLEQQMQMIQKLQSSHMGPGTAWGQQKGVAGMPGQPGMGPMGPNHNMSNGFAPMHQHPMHAAAAAGHNNPIVGNHSHQNPMMLGSHPMDHPQGPMAHPGVSGAQMNMGPHSMNGVNAPHSHSMGGLMNVNAHQGGPSVASPHQQQPGSHHPYGDLPPQMGSHPMDQMNQMRAGAHSAGGPASGSGMDAGTNMFNDYSQSRGMPPGMTTGSEAPPFPGMGRPSTPMNGMDLSQAEGQSNMIPKVFSLSDLTLELGAQLATDGDVSLSLLAGNESSGLGIFPKNMSLGDIAQLEAPLDMN
jgi:uncharacterized protein (TIGR01589 family)